MACKVSITAPAEEDIYLAFERIRKFSPRRSERWLRDLYSAVFSLANMPARCPLIPEAGDW